MNVLPQRQLGTAGFAVSEIGFGGWAIGADWGAPVPEAQALAALRTALDEGMTFIDTADIYGMGRSEKLIGQILTERGGRAVDGSPLRVGTKMGRFPGWSPALADVRAAAERSCINLGVSTLDLVQLHCIDIAFLHQGEVINSLEQLRSEGLIRAYGVSVETIEEARWCLENTGAAALQVIFNLFRQRVVRDLLPYAAKAGVGLIARVPLASGLLSGRWSAHQTFDPLDHRHFNANGEHFNVGETFAGVPLAEGIALAAEMSSVLGGSPDGTTLGPLALRWILDHPAISSVIPGIKTSAQATENARASRCPALSEEAHRALNALYFNEIDSIVRGRY
jgi:aryl-alcohol dehydrogenase-like predicted oxidoreductase